MEQSVWGTVWYPQRESPIWGGLCLVDGVRGVRVRGVHPKTRTTHSYIRHCGAMCGDWSIMALFDTGTNTTAFVSYRHSRDHRLDVWDDGWHHEFAAMWQIAQSVLSVWQYRRHYTHLDISGWHTGPAAPPAIDRDAQFDRASGAPYLEPFGPLPLWQSTGENIVQSTVESTKKSTI